MTIDFGVHANDVIGEATIVCIGLPIKDQIDQIKSREQGRWKPDVIDYGEFRVILGVNRVGGRKDCGPCIQGTDNTSFSNGYSLLLHGFMKDHASAVIHFVELVDAANTAVREHKSTALQYDFSCLWVFGNVYCETNRRGSFT